MNNNSAASSSPSPNDNIDHPSPQYYEPTSFLESNEKPTYHQNQIYEATYPSTNLYQTKPTDLETYEIANSNTFSGEQDVTNSPQVEQTYDVANFKTSDMSACKQTEHSGDNIYNHLNDDRSCENELNPIYN